MSVHTGSNGHDTEEKLYECSECLGHHTSTERLAACPDCGGPIENLTKPRGE